MTLLALQDLFRHHRERATGLWRLGVEPSRTIFFDSGDIVFAQSTHATDRLTHLLVERGKLTQTQLDYALANLKPGISIGKNLIEMGFITQRDLLDVARAQVERVVQGGLGTPDLEPVFEEKELDATVVRLPLDTPQLLLNGLLGLQDRERLLELLGPLNQVVVLQGRRLMEMSLPAELAKLPPLLDGTHTLLELSREVSTEPLRLGTFALFLREIGWARLHEMPPLDRQALDMALSSEPEPLSPSLPGPLPEGAPSLFSTIADAGRPTTNLEHLSSALDALPDTHELFPPEDEQTPVVAVEPPRLATVPEPLLDDSGFTVDSGQVNLPTPSMELPEPPAELHEEPEPAVVLQPSTLLAAPEATPEAPEPNLEEAPSGRSKSGLLVLASLLLVALGAGGWWWLHRMKAPAPVSPAPAAPKPVRPANPGVAVPPENTPPSPAPEPPKPEPPKPEPPKPEPPKPEPPKPEPPKPEPPKPVAAKAVPAVGTTAQERAEALRKGDLVLALKQGEAYVREKSAQRWTLRLEIACQGDTISRAAGLFPDDRPDLFLIPMKLRDGRTCYQIFYGKFASAAAAERQVATLPAPFREGGNRPKAFKIAEIPSAQ
jgi:hypothetical protein